MPSGFTVEAKANRSLSEVGTLFASTVKPDGTEVVALFNYDTEDPIRVTLAGTEHDVSPLGVKFVEIPKRGFGIFGFRLW